MVTNYERVRRMFKALKLKSEHSINFEESTRRKITKRILNVPTSVFSLTTEKVKLVVQRSAASSGTRTV